MKNVETTTPLQIVGKGKTCSCIWKFGDERKGWRYAFNFSRMCMATGHTVQQFGPEDLSDIASVIRLVAYEIGIDGCLDMDVRDDILCLAACLDQVLPSTSANQLRCVAANDQVATAIRCILDHLWDSERRDYLSSPRPNHVFTSLSLVANWIDGARPETRPTCIDDIVY